MAFWREMGDWINFRSDAIKEDRVRGP